MDVLSWIGEYITKNGITGAIFLFVVLDKLKVIDKISRWKKKLLDEPVHPHRRAEDNDDIIHFHRRDKDDFVELKKRFDEFMVKEAAEDVRLGVMDTKLNITAENVEKIFNLISDLKDKMLLMGYGKK